MFQNVTTLYCFLKLSTDWGLSILASWPLDVFPGTFSQLWSTTSATWTSVAPLSPLNKSPNYWGAVILINPADSILSFIQPPYRSVESSVNLKKLTISNLGSLELVDPAEVSHILKNYQHFLTFCLLSSVPDLLQTSPHSQLEMDHIAKGILGNNHPLQYRGIWD